MFEELEITHSDAVLSDDQVYRYTLMREWNPNNLGSQLCWLMLNPSTADWKLNDPTIKRCIQFTHAFGFTRMVVVNLFALRSPKPTALKLHNDPIGPDNNKYILENAVQSSLIICAWGNGGSLFERDQAVLSMLKRIGVKTYCLGMTINGNPRHPLYLSERVRLELFDQNRRTR